MIRLNNILSRLGVRMALDATTAAADLALFVDGGATRNTLALVYGRRRIGKSTALSRLANERRGFYWEATRAKTPIQLARLGVALGQHLGD